MKSLEKLPPKKHRIPKDEILPKGSDVDSVLKLFSKRQLAELAILRKLIFKKTTHGGSKEHRIKKRNMRYSLTLAFYNTLSLINLTYHNAPKGGPASSVIRYYRYRIAKMPDFLDTAALYRQKIKRIIQGKSELLESSMFYDSYFAPLRRVIKDFKNPLLKDREDLSGVDSMNNNEKIFQADATNLVEIESESIDFIYTDPPYGAKIPYLDLSIMWNVWLDLEVDSTLRKKECIEKGSLNKSSDEYQGLMAKSLKEMYRILKYNRWLAFVFQHQDPKLWQTIIESAKSIGFKYIGTMRQSNGQTSFKKRQKPFSVLSGQLIIYFRKTDSPSTRVKNVEFDVNILVECAKSEIIRNHGATMEEIHDCIMIKAMDEGFLGELSEKFNLIMPLIEQNLIFDKKSKKYHIAELKSHDSLEIPLEVRANYFITSYLNHCRKVGKDAFFDDICLEIIPKLSNGIVPDSKYIKQILEEIAICDVKSGVWNLKSNDRGLFE